MLQSNIGIAHVSGAGDFGVLLLSLTVVGCAGVGVASRPLFPVAVLCTIPDPQHPTVYDLPCQDRIDAYSLYAQHINQGVLVNGIPHTLNITYFDVGFGTDPNDITKVSAVAKKIIIDNAYGYFPVIIAPYSSLYTLVVAGFGEAAKRVVYASAAITDLIFECPSPPNPILGADCISTGKRPGDRRYQYTFATSPTAYSRWNGLIYSVKVAGAQTVAIIDSTDPASQSQGAGGTAAALANNLQIVIHRRLVGNETLADRVLVDAWLAQVRNNWPNLDVLLINNWAELQFGCGNVILSLRAMNWLPNTVGCAFSLSTPELIDIVGGDGHTQQYMVVAGNFDPRLKTTVDPSVYSNDPWVSSIELLTNNTRPDAAWNAYLSQSAWRAPIPWTVQYATAMYDMTVLHRALAVTRVNYTHVANTSDPQQMSQAAVFTDALRQSTQGLFEPTWFGRAQFDQVGRLATDAIVGQTKDTALAFEVIYPLASQTAPFIYPMPTWDERVYTPGYGKLQSEKLVLGVNAVVVAVALGLAVFVIVFRHAKTVKASSPVFLLCMLLGCILMTSSINAWTLHETKSSCFAHVWLFSIGYILMFAALFVKTWRLYRIFSSSNLKVQALPDGKLFGLVCAPLLAFELVYLAIWSVVAPFEARTTVVDPLRPAYNYDACYYNNTSQGFFLASLAYKLAFLVAGCILIFIARNIPSSFNETPFIGAAVYNALFSSTILVPIVATDALGRESRFLVRSFGIMIATLLTELIVVCPKIYHLMKFGDVKLSFHISSSKLPSKHGSAETVDVDPEHTLDVPKSPASTAARTRTSTEPLSAAGRAHPLSPRSNSQTHMVVSQEPSITLLSQMTLQQLHTNMMETQIKLSQIKQLLQQKQAQQPQPQPQALDIALAQQASVAQDGRTPRSVSTSHVERPLHGSSHSRYPSPSHVMNPRQSGAGTGVARWSRQLLRHTSDSYSSTPSMMGLDSDRAHHSKDISMIQLQME